MDGAVVGAVGDVKRMPAYGFLGWLGCVGDRGIHACDNLCDDSTQWQYARLQPCFRCYFNWTAAP